MDTYMADVDNSVNSQRDENTPLLHNAIPTPESDHHCENIRVVKTWRHLLIGPIVCLYFFGMISSFYLLVEYTNKYWKDEEYRKSNLSQLGTFSPCRTNVSTLVSHTETQATSKASEWIMYYSIAAGVPAVLANLVLGSYMDVVGRKLVLSISMLGTGLRLLISGIVIYCKADLVYFLIACVVEGCTGQHATCVAASLAYIADITVAGKERAMGIAIIEALVGISLSIGSLATGYMVQKFGYEIPIFTNAGLLGIAFVIAARILPETFKKEDRRKENSPIRTFKVASQFFTRNDEQNSKWKYQLTIVALILTSISVLSRVPTETLYQLAQPFCWSPRKIGIYAAVRTMCMMVIGLGSLKILQKYLDEVSLAVLGSLSHAVALYWTAFVTDDLSYYFVIVVELFGPFSTAMQRTILSHLTPADKQGAIFTVVGVVEIVTVLVGNVTTSAIYAKTVSVMRGLVFLVLGSYNAMSMILMIILKIGWYRERRTSSGKE